MEATVRADTGLDDPDYLPLVRATLSETLCLRVICLVEDESCSRPAFELNPTRLVARSVAGTSTGLTEHILRQITV